MTRILSKNKRRTGVILNMTALFLTVFVFELIRFETGIGNLLGFSMMGLFMIIVILSFIYVFGSTGIWKMDHQTIKNFDERQIQVVLNATRISYSIFVILVLIIIYGFALIEKGSIDVVLAASLLYLAHILPVSILAWTEREIQLHA